MADKNSATLGEVKAAAEDLLIRAASPEVMGSDLFPYGVSRLEVFVKAGDISVSLQMSGPDHPHAHEDEEMWDFEEDEDDLFDEDDAP